MRHRRLAVGTAFATLGSTGTGVVFGDEAEEGVPAAAAAATGCSGVPVESRRRARLVADPSSLRLRRFARVCARRDPRGRPRRCRWARR